jgi:hypothetical protein
MAEVRAVTRKRHLGGVAAIGAPAAAIALLAALFTAKADELSNLRANQQLLQQRIDQLAQPQPQPPASVAEPDIRPTAAPYPPSAGGSFPRSFLIPGTSTSVRIGGSADETLRYGTPR